MPAVCTTMNYAVENYRVSMVRSGIMNLSKNGLAPLPKLRTRVRFSSLAPRIFNFVPSTERGIT
jgi:hypothetical protein